MELMDLKIDRRTARAESFKRKVLESAKELFIEHGLKDNNHADC